MSNSDQCCVPRGVFKRVLERAGGVNELFYIGDVDVKKHVDVPISMDISHVYTSDRTREGRRGVEG